MTEHIPNPPVDTAWEETERGTDEQVAWRRYVRTDESVEYLVASDDHAEVGLMHRTVGRPDHYVFSERRKDGELRRWRFVVTTHSEGENIAVTSSGYVVMVGPQMSTQVTGADVPKSILTLLEQLDLNLE